MAKHTHRNKYYLNKYFLAALYCLVATAVWAACSNYVSPPNPATGNRDYGTRNCTGCSDFHAGWDLGTDQGKATISGTVTMKADNGGLGNTIIVSNGNMQIIYAHACTLNTNLNGTTISQGQSLGNWSSCCTGNCSSGANTCTGATSANPCSAGMHVHYEVQVKDSSGQWRAVDPAVVRDMVAQGKDPCSPSFADEAVDKTIAIHGHLANGAGGATGTPGVGTPVPTGGMCTA